METFILDELLLSSQPEIRWNFIKSVIVAIITAVINCTVAIFRQLFSYQIVINFGTYMHYSNCCYWVDFRGTNLDNLTIFNNYYFMSLIVIEKFEKGIILFFVIEFEGYYFAMC